jgi:7-carboxy-7-deazaguanine synthase
MEGKYYITEYFESLQGEGNHAGELSLFIRFHFCNLTCCWCDTKYTWLKKSGPYKEYTKEQLIELIENKNIINVVFTGGEPALYKLDELVCDKKNYHVESNGMFIPDKPVDITLNDGTRLEREAMKEEIFSRFNWVISPKLSNAKQNIDNDCLMYWKDKDYCIFKFIIKEGSDLKEVNEIVHKYTIPRNKIYVGLEGTTIDSQLRPDLVDSILQNGFNYSPRLQILLWGNQRAK